MISLFTRSFAESFDPVGPTPFLPVTQLQFLLSRNWSLQTRGPWQAVTLCHVQEAGLICSLLMKCTWCVDSGTERDDLWPRTTTGGLYFLCCTGFKEP